MQYYNSINSFFAKSNLWMSISFRIVFERKRTYFLIQGCNKKSNYAQRLRSDLNNQTQAPRKTRINTRMCQIHYNIIELWQPLRKKHKTIYKMSRILRKPDFCICENKDADQLRGNREADQRPCFRYTDRTIPLLPKSETSSL